MANTFIGRVAARAKQIRKAQPNIKWQTAIKRASLELRGKVKNKPVKKTVMRRRKKTTVSGMPVIGRVRRTASAPRKKTTVNSTLAKAKNMLLDEIGNLAAKQFKARLKRDKKKIGKKIAAAKSKYRKL